MAPSPSLAMYCDSEHLSFRMCPLALTKSHNEFATVVQVTLSSVTVQHVASSSKASCLRWKPINNRGLSPISVISEWIYSLHNSGYLCGWPHVLGVSHKDVNWLLQHNSLIKLTSSWLLGSYLDRPEPCKSDIVNMWWHPFSFFI